MSTRTIEFEFRELLDLDSALISTWNSTAEMLALTTKLEMTQSIKTYTNTLANLETLWAKSQIAQMGNGYKFMTLAELDAHVKANA